MLQKFFVVVNNERLANGFGKARTEYSREFDAIGFVVVLRKCRVTESSRPPVTRTIGMVP